MVLAVLAVPMLLVALIVIAEPFAVEVKLLFNVILPPIILIGPATLAVPLTVMSPVFPDLPSDNEAAPLLKVKLGPSKVWALANDAPKGSIATFPVVAILLIPAKVIALARNVIFADDDVTFEDAFDPKVSPLIYKLA